MSTEGFERTNNQRNVLPVRNLNLIPSEVELAAQTKPKVEMSAVEAAIVKARLEITTRGKITWVYRSPKEIADHLVSLELIKVRRSEVSPVSLLSTMTEPIFGALRALLQPKDEELSVEAKKLRDWIKDQKHLRHLDEIQLGQAYHRHIDPVDLLDIADEAESKPK